MPSFLLRQGDQQVERDRRPGCRSFRRGLGLLHGFLGFLSEFVETKHLMYFLQIGCKPIGVQSAILSLIAAGVQNRAGFCTPLPVRLRYCLMRFTLDFDFDLARLGGFLLGKGDGQHAVLVSGRNFSVSNVGGTAKLRTKFAVAALDAVIALCVFVLLELALPRDGQGLVFHADIDVFGSTSGRSALSDQFVLGFVDVDGGGPRTVAAGFVHQPGEGIFEEAEILEGVKGDCEVLMVLISPFG